MNTIKKHLPITILCIVLAISFAISIWQNARLLKYSNERSIVGTYAISGISSTRYFVFTSDNMYMYYEQPNVIEQGVYRIDESQKESRVITLANANGDGETQLVRIGKSIYYHDSNSVIIVFDKIDDVPIYAGVDPAP